MDPAATAWSAPTESRWPGLLGIPVQYRLPHPGRTAVLPQCEIGGDRHTPIRARTLDLLQRGRLVADGDAVTDVQPHRPAGIPPRDLRAVARVLGMHTLATGLVYAVTLGIAMGIAQSIISWTREDLMSKSHDHQTRDDVARSAKLQRYWDKQAGSYDRRMGFWDRRLFGDSRRWACSQASGEVLEVAIGTGLNIPVYPEQITLTGIDLSEGMLDVARARATELGRPVRLLQGDAHALPFEDAAFDTVVCTFSLCSIPKVDTAVGQMRRVLRPGGRLVLADHIESSWMPVRGLQRLLELITVPQADEHFRRRPLNQVRAARLSIEQAQRFKLGIVERLTARKPATP